MKKLLLSLLLLAPFGVNAMSYSESFSVGDEVIVEMGDNYKDSKAEAFNVLAASASGENYVTVIYDGIVAGPVVYDKVATDGSHDTLTSDLTKATIYQDLLSATNDWNYAKDPRLLTIGDLTNIGINATNGKYVIGASYSWLSARKLTDTTLTVTPEMYNYWTSSADTSDTTKTAVYCVTYNEDRTDVNGDWSTLESKDLGDGIYDTAPKCSIRPVITIDKAYILCNNSKTPTTTTTVSNVKTGNKDYYLPLLIMLIIAIGCIIVIRRKTLFKKL